MADTAKVDPYFVLGDFKTKLILIFNLGDFKTRSYHFRPSADNENGVRSGHRAVGQTPGEPAKRNQLARGQRPEKGIFGTQGVANISRGTSSP